jgi:hypothetical protein
MDWSEQLTPRLRTRSGTTTSGALACRDMLAASLGTSSGRLKNMKTLQMNDGPTSTPLCTPLALLDSDVLMAMQLGITGTTYLSHTKHRTT